MNPNRKQDALGRFVRADGTPAPLPEPGIKHRRGPARFKHFRIDALPLTPEQREEYERLLADPTSTVQQLQDWLRARGHRVCRSAVTRHRHSFHADLTRLREVARMAQSLCELSRKQPGGPGVIAEAAAAHFEMNLMESLHKMKGAPDLPAAEWRQMAATLAEIVATRRSVEAMREEFERRAKAAVEEAQRKNVTSEDVADRMRQILLGE